MKTFGSTGEPWPVSLLYRKIPSTYLLWKTFGWWESVTWEIRANYILQFQCEAFFLWRSQRKFHIFQNHIFRSLTDFDTYAICVNLSQYILLDLCSFWQVLENLVVRAIVLNKDLMNLPLLIHRRIDHKTNWMHCC